MVMPCGDCRPKPCPSWRVRLAGSNVPSGLAFISINSLVAESKSKKRLALPSKAMLMGSAIPVAMATDSSRSSIGVILTISVGVPASKMRK